MFVEEKLNLCKEWDKTFDKSNNVNHRKVCFHNRYGITLAADLYEPKDKKGKLPAIAISGPFGAVKERRERGKSEKCRIPRYQYRRFLCSC